MGERGWSVTWGPSTCENWEGQVSKMSGAVATLAKPTLRHLHANHMRKHVIIGCTLGTIVGVASWFAFWVTPSENRKAEFHRKWGDPAFVQKEYAAMKATGLFQKWKPEKETE